MSIGRLTATACALALGLLAVAAPAEAKIFFGDIGGRTLEWNQRTTATIAGCSKSSACREHVQGVVVYLRPGSRSRSRPEPGTLERLGRISADGTISFRVPRVRAGRYHLLARIPVDSGGKRWFPASGSFRIRRG